jgi:hypothetical protein
MNKPMKLSIHKKGKKDKFSNMLDSVVVEHGHVLVWQPRDDERYMHAFSFTKHDSNKYYPSVMRL